MKELERENVRLNRRKNTMNETPGSTRMEENRVRRPLPFDDGVALVLQGGGALGAYQAGVFQACRDRALRRAHLPQEAPSRLTSSRFWPRTRTAVIIRVRNCADQSKLQICNVVWSSQSRHCKRRGDDTRADEVVGLVVGTAGATSAAAELRRRPRFIILGTRRMRGVKPLRLGLFPSGDYSRAFQAGGLRWCQIQERIERGRP
jgi:hypothetical protein